METFKIVLEKKNKLQPKVQEAIHTDGLKQRTGYDVDFLDINLPLPVIKEQDEFAKLPMLSNDVGANGPHILDYTHFSIAFNKTTKMPFFTAVNIYGKTNVLGVVHEERGSDSWYTDDRIKEDKNTFQYGNSNYRGTGLAKGHLVRYYDPAWGDDLTTKIAIGDTFHYTNCCPQIPYFNGVVWNYLEDYCIARSIFQDNKITLFAGPIFNKAQMIRGLLTPMNFWKILVYENNGKLSALGFLMSQEPYLQKLKMKGMLLEEKKNKTVAPTLTISDIERLFQKQELLTARIKISLIEEKTGLTFGLSEADEFKDLDQYIAEPLSKPNFKSMGKEHFSNLMDDNSWRTFLKEL
jgi:DNA/RNA endonuclease G (NUC1)